jgi:hypothetical protein
MDLNTNRIRCVLYSKPIYWTNIQKLGKFAIPWLNTDAHARTRLYALLVIVWIFNFLTAT